MIRGRHVAFEATLILVVVVREALAHRLDIVFSPDFINHRLDILHQFDGMRTAIGEFQVWLKIVDIGKRLTLNEQNPLSPAEHSLSALPRTKLRGRMFADERVTAELTRSRILAGYVVCH